MRLEQYDLTTCSRIFGNPSVAYPTILTFMLIDNTKPLNSMKMDFATCIRFHSSHGDMDKRGGI